VRPSSNLTLGPCRDFKTNKLQTRIEDDDEYEHDLREHKTPNLNAKRD
jgi:hypothetical protein